MNDHCPHCHANALPEEEQPYPGTQAFSIKYRCGSQIVVIITGKYWEWEKECTRTIEDDGK